jgi:transposase
VSSGQVQRHRLNRAGARQLNRALHMIVLARLRHHEETRAYAARREAEGKSPREKSSGVSVRGHSTIGSFGPAHLRRALYLPAVVAMRANPRLRAFAERLRAKGKPAKVVIVAVMRKLLLLAWTLLRTGQPFAASDRTPDATAGSAPTRPALTTTHLAPT